MRNLFIYLAVIFLTTPQMNKAQAAIDVPTLRLGIGKSSLNFIAGSSFPTKTPLQSTFTLHPMFLWDVPRINMRLGVNFLADLGSPYGFISNAGIGLTGIFYPFGLSSSREVGENFSEIVKTRVSPFVQFGITPTKFSVVNPDPSKDPTTWDNFRASLVDVSIGAGIDYPFADDLVGFIGVNLRNAVFTGDESQQDGNISYNGMEILLGLMTNFY